MPKERSAAWLEGYESFQTNKKNPYPQGTQSHTDFNNGYDAGQYNYGN